jgi:type I restriction enzyme S subunit
VKPDTSVGWKTARIRFKARVNPKATLDLELSDQVSFVPMEAVGEDGTLVLDRTKAVAEVAQGYTYFENGDVSIAKITPCFENGKGAVMEGLFGGAGFGTTELIVLRPEEGVSPRFLYYVTQADHFRSPGEAAMLGSGGQKRVPDLFVKDFAIAWPTSEVQAAIASYLDAEMVRIDVLIEEKQKLKRLLADFRNATITDSVLGRIENAYKDKAPSGTWRTMRLRFNARLNPKATVELNPEDEVSFVPMEAIGEDGSLALDRTRLLGEVSHGYTYFENGDVCVAKITPCFENGKGAVMQGLVGGVGFGTTELIVLRPEDAVSPRFMYYVMRSEHFRKPGEAAMLGAGGQKRLPDLFVKDFSTPWPEIDVQESIASFLDEQTVRIDRLFAHVVEEIDLLEQLRSATITDAVLGCIDVREHMKS